MFHIAVLPKQEAAHDEIVGQIEGIGDGYPNLVALVKGVDDALQQAERFEGILLVGRQLADDVTPRPTLQVSGHYQHDHIDVGAQSRQNDVDALIDSFQRTAEKEIDHQDLEQYPEQGECSRQRAKDGSGQQSVEDDDASDGCNISEPMGSKVRKF